jgi:hypothetical protein
MAHKSIEQDLLGLEKQYWEAIKHRDVETAMRLSDDSCIIAGAHGVERIDRATLAKMMTSASYTLQDFTISDDAQVRVLGDDVAVLAYDVHERLKVDGQTVALDAAEASTWVRRNGRWLCALHVESLRGDPFGRDRVTAR